MKKFFCAVGVGLIVLAGSGCSSMPVARVGITDFTSKTEYTEIAKGFLSDEVLMGPAKTADKTKIQGYCLEVSGENSFHSKELMFSFAQTLEKIGFKNLTRNGLFDPERGVLGTGLNTDFTVKNNFCMNFLAFTGELSADEKRKFLIYLGKDYFEVNWMEQLLTKGYYPRTIAKKDMLMIEDAGFSATSTERSDAKATDKSKELMDFSEFVNRSGETASAVADSKINYQKNIDWQRRNAGIAMLAWLQQHSDEWGYLNPKAMDTLVLQSLTIPENSRYIPLSNEYKEFLSMLNQPNQNSRSLKRVSIDTVSEEVTREVIDYARWIANGKPENSSKQ